MHPVIMRKRAAGLLAVRSPHGHETRYAAVGYHHGPQVIQPTR